MCVTRLGEDSHRFLQLPLWSWYQPIGDRRQRNRRGEALRLRDDPARRVAASQEAASTRHGRRIVTATGSKARFLAKCGATKERPRW